MATTYTTNAPQDNSTFANYKLWAQAISTAFSTLGWVQTNDTGQIVWTATVLTLTQMTVSGSNAVYSYSSYTGPDPRVGMSVIITGFATSANNVTATLTAVSGGSSGTVTVVKVSQVNETHAGSGTTTAASVVPSNSFTSHYEIWSANDAQAATLPIFVKIGYGFSSSIFGIGYTVGCGSNGTGTISNILSGFNVFNPATPSVKGSTTYPCYFSGDAGEFRMGLFATLSDQWLFVIERSKDASGNKTGAYFTAIAMASSVIHQQSCDAPGSFPAYDSWAIALPCSSGNRATGFYSGTVAAFPFFPLLGYVGNPMLGIMACVAADITDNTTVTVASMYGSTHTYVALKGGSTTAYNSIKGAFNGAASAILLRYE